MSSQFSDEQISSYFDDEVSPEERTEIERLLKTSDEVRREFEDYRKLSALVKNLPVESAPRNLSANVSRKLQSVLAQTTVASSPSKANPSHRRLWRFAGTLAAIVVVLMVAVKLFDSDPNQRDQLELADSQSKRADFSNRELPERTPSAADEGISQPIAESQSDKNIPRPSESRKDLVAGDQSNSFGGASPRLNKKASLPPSAPIVAVKPAVDARKPSATPPIGTGNLVDLTNDPQSPQPGKNGSGLIIENLQELKDAEIGTMITALEKTNEGITVVKLTVVDRQAGLKSLQVLLSRHRIALDDEKGKQSGSSKKSKSRSRKEKNKTGRKQSERLVAVYVEASSRQLSAALGDLRNSDLFQRLHVRGPIPEAQFNRYAGGGTFSGGSGATTSNAMTSSGRGAGSPAIGGSFRIQIGTKRSGKSDGNSNASVEAKKPAGAFPKSGVDAKSLADQQDADRKNKASTLKELERISRQLELSLSPEILTELAQTTGRTGRSLIGSRAGGTSVQLNSTFNQSSNRNKNAAKVLKADPLKVLFILVVNEPSKPKASPSVRPAERTKKTRSTNPKKSSGNGAA